MPTICVTQTDAGERLDRYLTKHMDTSRAQVQKLIKSGAITINGETAATKTPVGAGDQIFYPEAETYSPPEKTAEAPILESFYEDDDIWVINKPAGLIVHPANAHDISPTVVDALLERSPDSAHVGDDPSRPGIVHRLDRDVSGVMVVCKTQEAYEHIKAQFKNRTTKKEYLTLVYGTLPKHHDTITHKIARSKAKGRMVARTGEQEGKEAKTDYDVIERFDFATYTKIQIHTGRTHQIRVHMFAIGHPVVGDKLYRIKAMEKKALQMDRLFLHAHRLEFKHLNGEQLSFESPLPEELKVIKDKLSKP